MPLPLTLFGGLRPFSRVRAIRDAVAGVTLASMNIPQVLGYTRIAETPVVTGLYTVLLPLVAFATFGSSATWSWPPTRQPPLSSPAGCRAWRRPQARGIWRWSAWWRC